MMYQICNGLQRLCNGLQRLCNGFQRLCNGLQRLCNGLQRLCNGLQRLCVLDLQDNIVWTWMSQATDLEMYQIFTTQTMI
jgi:hypothetical protein